MIPTLSRWLRLPVIAGAFLLFWWGGLFVSWAALPFVRFGMKDPQLRARRCREVIAAAFRLHLAYMRITGLVGFDPTHLRARLPTGPFVVVANHPSLIDVVLLIASCPQLVCVVNTRYFSSPFVGRLLRLSGHIDAGAGGLEGGRLVIDRGIERLAAGEPILIFPEGTRSPVRGTHRFRQGAFLMAREAGVPVVPVHVTCDPPALMKGTPWYTVPRERIRFTMTVLPAIEAGAFQGEARELAAEVRSQLQAQTERFYRQAATQGDDSPSLALTG